jgi:glycosyltransferase involved in cell wall biosynthesis
MMNSIEYIILEVEKIYGMTNKIPLVIVGNLSTDYGKYILDKYGSCEFVLFLGFISNPDELNILRKCAIAYIHGQVTGGTSPALLEALASGMIIASFDSISNRATMKDTNYYFYYDYNYYLENGKYKELLEDSLTLSEKSLSSILEYIVNNYNKIYKTIESSNIALTTSEYSIEKISKLHLDLYRGICSGL